MKNKPEKQLIPCKSESKEFTRNEKHSKECQKRTGVSHIECECWCHSCIECQFEDNTHSQSCSKHVEKDPPEKTCNCCEDIHPFQKCIKTHAHFSFCGKSVPANVNEISSKLAANSTTEERIEKILSDREEKMYHYYKSVFKEDFEGGYPIGYDDEIKYFISKLLSEARYGDYGRRMYQRGHEEGRKEMREACEKVIPLLKQPKLEGQEYNVLDCEPKCVFGYNACRNEILSAITNIKI